MKSIRQYFKLARSKISNKVDKEQTRPGFNKYTPHQGKQEKARRIQQMERLARKARGVITGVNNHD